MKNSGKFPQRNCVEMKCARKKRERNYIKTKKQYLAHIGKRGIAFLLPIGNYQMFFFAFLMQVKRLSYSWYALFATED